MSHGRFDAIGAFVSVSTFSTSFLRSHSRHNHSQFVSAHMWQHPGSSAQRGHRIFILQEQNLTSSSRGSHGRRDDQDREEAGTVLRRVRYRSSICQNGAT